MQSEPPMSARSELGDTDAIAAADAEPAEAADRVRKALVIAAAGLATILVVGFVALLIATRVFVAGGRIAPNVAVAGLDLAGMSRDEALDALRAQWVPTLPAAVKVPSPGGEWEADRDELGVSLRLEEAADQAVAVGRQGGLFTQLGARLRLARQPVQIPVAVDIDEDTLEDAVGGLADIVDCEPVDADISVAGDDVEIVPGQVGCTLDIEGTMRAVHSALADPAAREVAAVVTTEEPAVTAEDLAHIEVVLGRYSTPYNPGRVDRSHNLRLAVGKLNETVIRPGEEFSFNQTVGERVVEDGYREAPIFINGEIKPSMGGGICQIASTTYNAVLLANLDVLERHHHSRPVDYVPTGRDATVYWSQYDLKFRNSLDHPILLLAEVGSSTVTIRFLGSREDDADVEITREGLTRISHGVKEVDDPELDEGEEEVEKKGRDGWRVTVYRKATRDGRVVRDERLHTDYYSPQTKVVHVGTRPPEDAEEGAEGPETPGDEQAPPADTPAPDQPESTTPPLAPGAVPVPPVPGGPAGG